MVVLTKIERKAIIRARYLASLKDGEMSVSYDNPQLMWDRYAHKRKFERLSVVRLEYRLCLHNWKDSQESVAQAQFRKDYWLSAYQYNVANLLKFDSSRLPN